MYSRQYVIRDGSFRNVRQLVNAMEMYLAERNLNAKSKKPKPPLVYDATNVK